MPIIFVSSFRPLIRAFFPVRTAMTNECNASLFSALICSLLSPRSYCWSLTPQSIISPNIVIILGADSSYKVAISSISLATAIIAIRIFFIFLVAPTAFNCSTCFGILSLNSFCRIDKLFINSLNSLHLESKFSLISKISKSSTSSALTSIISLLGLLLMIWTI